MTALVQCELKIGSKWALGERAAVFKKSFYDF